MNWQRIRRISALALVGIGVAVAAFLYDPRTLFDGDPLDAPTVRDTALVEVASLSDNHSRDGTLLFADAVVAYATIGPGAATITELLEEGAAVGRGDVLWRLGNEPTVALFGEIPLYRGLQEGDEGNDVMQLEENLVALGLDPDGTVTIDEDFTATTVAMVERWQETIGAEVTGIVAASSFVSLDGPRLVGDIAFVIGDQLGDDVAVMTLTATDRELVFGVPPTERDDIALGQSVSARLPGRAEITGVVSELAPNDNGGLIVTAVLDQQPDVEVDQVPVTVTWSNELAADVLTVPATALIRTDDGRYHVEVRDSGGEERFVVVTLGASSGGTVEITGEVTPGDRVIAP